MGIRVAGVHVKSGALNVAVVDQGDDGGDAQLISTVRLQPNAALSDSARLSDLSDRFRQHLSPARVSAVAILDTRSFSNWKYAAAFSRVFGICAVLQGSSMLSMEAITYRTNKVGASVSLPADRLRELSPEVVGTTNSPTYWTTGMAEASAVAVHALKEFRDRR